MGEPDGPRPLTVVTDASDGDHPTFLRGLDEWCCMSPAWLSPSEMRLPLLQEGSHAFLVILGLPR